MNTVCSLRDLVLLLYCINTVLPYFVVLFVSSLVQIYLILLYNFISVRNSHARYKIIVTQYSLAITAAS